MIELFLVYQRLFDLILEGEYSSQFIIYSESDFVVNPKTKKPTMMESFNCEDLLRSSSRRASVPAFSLLCLTPYLLAGIQDLLPFH
jgi:hypothetical protein